MQLPGAPEVILSQEFHAVGPQASAPGGLGAEGALEDLALDVFRDGSGVVDGKGGAGFQAMEPGPHFPFRWGGLQGVQHRVGQDPEQQRVVRLEVGGGPLAEEGEALASRGWMQMEELHQGVQYGLGIQISHLGLQVSPLGLHEQTVMGDVRVQHLAQFRDLLERRAMLRLRPAQQLGSHAKPLQGVGHVVEEDLLQGLKALLGADVLDDKDHEGAAFQFQRCGPDRELMGLFLSVLLDPHEAFPLGRSLPDLAGQDRQEGAALNAGWTCSTAVGAKGYPNAPEHLSWAFSQQGRGVAETHGLQQLLVGRDGLPVPIEDQGASLKG